MNADIDRDTPPLSAKEVAHFKRDRLDWGMTAGPGGTPLMDIHKVLDRLVATIDALQMQIDELEGSAT